MKKKGIVILLGLMLMVMIGCKAEAQPQDEAPQATESNEVEPTAPIESDEPAEPSAKAEPMTALVEITQEELTEFFEMAYDVGQSYAVLGYDEDSLIKQELEVLSSFMEGGTIKWPDDVNDQYFAWREANHPQEPEVTQAPSNNTQTKPVQQAPSAPQNNGTQTTNNQQTGGYTSVIGNVDYAAHEAKDPGESSFFKVPDDPWSSNAKIDYGGN